jgi:HD-GYP domain-containing protein (c-di-GMP phosphodiesterase class II)
MLVAFATIAIALLAGWGLGNPAFVVALAAVAAIAERGSIRVSHTAEESISLLPTLFAAVLFGPLAAAVVGAASMLGDLRPPYLRWLVYTSTRTITGALTGFAALCASGLSLSQFGTIAVSTLIGAVVAESLDLTFGAVTHQLRGNGTFWNMVRTVAPLAYAALPMYMPVVALLTIAYLRLSPWTAPLFFAPALAAQRLFVMYQDQRRLADDLLTANDRLERANLSFASALVATLDARDRYTAGHSAAVAIYSRDIAARMGLSEERQRLAHLCGLVHDIGKIGLPARLLEKPGALTLEERRLMETHPAIGEGILSKVDGYGEIASVVRHHHERVDGNGYPDGLEYDDIPLLSRVIAVADAYNAMTSDRPYREAMPSRVARLRLAQAVETQFDTSVVAAFEAILAGAGEDYRLGTNADFALEIREHQQRAHVVDIEMSLALAK